MFVTEDLKSAVAEAQEFEKNEIYTKSMCLKTTKGGVKAHTFEQALLSAKEYMTDEDVFFYKNFYKHFSTPKCVLPKGHSGPCSCSYQKFFPEQYAKKIKDCDTTPGDDDILYKNRARRIFPIQVNKKQYTVLNALHKWKASKIFMKAAIPTEFGGTNFTIATAHFDLAAILMLQKGIEHTLPKDIEEKLLDRAQDIVVEFKEQGITIVDADGNLRCPVSLETIEPEWYLNRDDDYQVQFGHVVPVKSDKYMTRGGNLLPITRGGNLMQSNRSIKGTYDWLRGISQKLSAEG
jgi:hypothetical protein